MIAREGRNRLDEKAANSLVAFFISEFVSPRNRQINQSSDHSSRLAGMLPEDTVSLLGVVIAREIKAEINRELPDSGAAATWVAGRDFFRFVPVHEEVAYFREPIDAGLELDR